MELFNAEKCKEPSDGITVDVKQTHRERYSTGGSTPSGSVVPGRSVADVRVAKHLTKNDNARIPPGTANGT